MHRAPAVSFSVTQSRWHLRAIVALGLLALVCTLSFVLAQARVDWRTVVPIVLTPTVLGVAIRARARAAHGVLNWDGQQWNWSGFSASQTCQLTLRMDFQFVMLVSVVADRGKPVFLWLEAAMGETHWRALRRAIVSSQRLLVPDVDVVPSHAIGGQQ